MKHRSSGAQGVRCFPLADPLTYFALTANEKDFSLSLEMTNAGKRHSRIESHLHEESVKRHSPSFPWKEVPQRGGGWHRSGMKVMCGEEAFSYRHPERSRGIFFVCRVPFPVWNGLHETPFFRGAGSTVFPACRSSHILCLDRERKRFLAFARNDECGEAAFSYRKPSSCEAREVAFSLLPMEGGAPKGRRLASQRTEKSCGGSIVSYRHPERSRGIFFVCHFLFHA